jgi:RHS repeat-associated protein
MNAFYKISIGAVIWLGLFVSAVSAQVGSDNPTGISGQFNGNVTTGCSYDPYTANATRSITDLVVAGGVGAYPLAFTRTMNSRYTAGVPTSFGPAGSWNHSFGWNIDGITVVKIGSVGRPASYNVNYPDGRRVIFSNTGTGDPDFRGPLGVRDRFENLTSGGTECYLRLPDGGRIQFHAAISTTHTGSGGSAIYTSVYSYSLVAIVDPYAQTTTIVRALDGTSMTVTEPAGRTIQIFYRPISSIIEGVVGDIVVDRVTGSDGRSVQYHYTAKTTLHGTLYTTLSSVVYFGDSSLTATYTYQASNSSDVDARPLIATCIDPMYDGPMWMIAYEFQPYISGVVYGQLLREKHPNGTVVSTLAVTGTSTRTETRGDNPTGSGNPTRTFSYSTYRLKTTTDFKAVPGSQDYDNNYYLASVTDRRGNVTTYACNALNGNTRHVKYPDVPGDTLPNAPTMALNYTFGDPANQDTSNRDPNNPYYLYSITNGRSFVNLYFRNAKMQIQRINYPDANNETFTYNQFGEKLTHGLRDGSSETWQYNDPIHPGQVSAYWDAAHPANLTATTRYQYDSAGRVSATTDGRGYTTTYLYNSRNQLLTLTHPDNTFVQNVYNPNGNGTLVSTTDELGHTTTFTYDDYKRPQTVTTPVRALGDNTPGTTITCYDQAVQCTQSYTPVDSYARTDAKPTKVLSPGGKTVLTLYDENLRTVSVKAVGDPNVVDGTTIYTYDAVGNRDTVTDPKGNVTRTYYDKQNRVKGVDDPMINDPATPHKNSDGHTVSYTYDEGGNKIQQRRVDSKICKFTYTQMGKLKTQSGYAVDTTPDPFPDITTYGYDNLGNVMEITDPKGAQYDYTYDGLKRKLTAKYPVDAGGTRKTERWHYDTANNLDTYTNPTGQVQTLQYDNRERLNNASWSGNAAPTVSTTYDAASRPMSITTSDGATIAYHYDNANNKTSEDQANSGLPMRTVQTDPDPDGNRMNLLVKTGATTNYALTYLYTSRNGLSQISDSANNSFKYVYGDANANVTRRDGLISQTLHDSAVYTYDALNRQVICAQSALNGPAFSTEHYNYNARGYLVNTFREEESRGDYYGYDPARDQLISALYSAISANDQSPAGNTVNYDCGALDRNGMTVKDSTNHTTTIGYAKDDLNQYTKVTTNGTDQGVQYDGNFNLSGYSGWTYTYDARNRLVSATGNSHVATFTYDGMGRCVKRVIDSAATVFTYDGWRQIAEWDGSNGNLIATNIYGIGIDEPLFTSNTYGQFYHKSDALGNVRFLLNSAGAVVEKYAYDAFGTPTITNLNGGAPTGNRFMFKGREYLVALGIYDNRQRVYHPGLGRFLQTDPIGLSGDPLNLYRFCGHNPLTGSDPMGTDWDTTNYASDVGYDGGDGSDELGYTYPSYYSDWGAVGGPPADVNLYDFGLGPMLTNSGTAPQLLRMSNFGITQGVMPDQAGPGLQGGTNSLAAGSGYITYSGQISYSATALILSYGRFKGTVTSDTIPPESYAIAGRVDGVGVQLGYVTGRTNVSLVATSPQGMIGPNGGFWTVSVGLDAGPIDVVSADVTINANPTPNGPTAAAFGSIEHDFHFLEVPSSTTSNEAAHMNNPEPGVGFSGAFFGISVQTVTPISPPLGQAPPSRR